MGALKLTVWTHQIILYAYRKVMYMRRNEVRKLRLNIQTWILFVGFCLSLGSQTGCPKSPGATQKIPANPPFFRDVPPDQGPWQVKVGGDDKSYQKLYLHGKDEVMIAATFARIDEQIEVDLTDPRNQQALAEISLQGFCKSLDAQCLVDSSDLAWIVGTSLKYIYVRFHAEKKGMPPLTGLIYYRFDQPFQTMYILLCDTKLYDSYEMVFLNYLSQAEFRPQGFFGS